MAAVGVGVSMSAVAAVGVGDVGGRRKDDGVSGGGGGEGSPKGCRGKRDGDERDEGECEFHDGPDVCVCVVRTRGVVVVVRKSVIGGSGVRKGGALCVCLYVI